MTNDDGSTKHVANSVLIVLVRDLIRDLDPSVVICRMPILRE